MPTSADFPFATQQQKGFTLIELLLVMVILAIGTAGAALALRDTQHDLLDREAVRLAALLEAGRAQSRASGVPVLWHGTAKDFAFAGIPAPLKGQTGLPTHWQTPVLLISGGRTDSLQDGSPITLILGPEPIIPAQQITLALPESPHIRRTISTDGLRPFVISDEAMP